MSGFTGQPGSENDLNGLLTQLRAQQNKQPELQPSYSYYSGVPNHQESQAYQQQSVSSALPTPSTAAQGPRYTSAVLNSAITAQPRIPSTMGGTTTNSDRTSSLLNLLKFQQPSASANIAPSSSTRIAPSVAQSLPVSRELSFNFETPNTGAQITAEGHGPGGSDLLATLTGSSFGRGSTHTSSVPQGARAVTSTSKVGATTSPPADTQAYLLSLLSKPKSTHNGMALSSQPAKPSLPANQPAPQDEVSHLTQALETTSLQKGASASMAKNTVTDKLCDVNTTSTNAPIFNYVNPFEQLSAPSPRHSSKPATPTIQPGPSAASIQILKGGNNSDNKRKMDERSAKSSPAPNPSKRRIDAPSQASSGPPTPLPDGRTQLEALIGIGAPAITKTVNKETVSEALQDVGSRVDEEVQEAIARAEQDSSESRVHHDLCKSLAASTENDVEQSATIAVKTEPDKKSKKHVLGDLPRSVTNSVIDDVGQGPIADSWESADPEEVLGKDKEEEGLVKIYDFPMKPWTVIAIRGFAEPRATFRSEIILDIARLKKEFDQVDRVLITASNSFIVYGMSKSGGIRVIRQDDGMDAKLFEKTQDRIYNVAISTSYDGDKSAVIGTGISGTIYWANVKNENGDCIGESHPEMHGFALPPIPSEESDSLGGALKTRARKSSNHPEYFAIGRGRAIYIISPSFILKQKCFKQAADRIVNVESYLKKESLKIHIGKGSKDFIFSEDDTVIVSLDKAGCVKFWDIRPLLEVVNSAAPSPMRKRSMEINEAVLTLTTTNSNEKAWPTSLLFVDKQRAYQSGVFRYIIIGTNQNHTLQLWDLALGKIVQEIQLPHKKGSDAVCSVLYHAATSMVVVGHPTRNSIYFLHLSAPRYILPRSITQADYIASLKNPDLSGFKPSATAVFSGVREYSFANKGILRSLDILPVPNRECDPPTMFELYAMHSKGVTCLDIKHADLGWTLDNKVIRSVDAKEAGLITVEPIQETPTTPDASSENPTPGSATTARVQSQFVPKEILKKPINVGIAIPFLENQDEKKDSVPTNKPSVAASIEPKDKKRRRKINSSAETPAATKVIANDLPQTEALSPGTEFQNDIITKPTEDTLKTGINCDYTDLSAKLSREVETLLGASFASLAKDIKDDRRTQGAVAEAKQETMLRLISSTLSDNIEATLGRIVNDSIKATVVPTIAQIVSQAVDDSVKKNLVTKLNIQIAETLPREIQRTIPDTIAKALQNAQLLKLMSDALARGVAFKVEEKFATILHDSVTPAFKQLAIQTSHSIGVDIRRQAVEQMGTIERQRHSDSVKIQSLTDLVTDLSRAVSAMAKAQIDFQAEFLENQQQAASEKSASRPSEPLAALTAPVEKTPGDREYDEMMQAIREAMDQGKFEHAVISWLQTGREQEFFRNYFVQYKPTFIQNLSLLLLISVGASISSTEFSDLLHERLDWVETVIVSVANRLAVCASEEFVQEHQDVIPKITQIYIQRLEHLFMRISNSDACNPVLKRISQLVNIANRVLDMTSSAST